MVLGYVLMLCLSVSQLFGANAGPSSPKKPSTDSASFSSPKKTPTKAGAVSSPGKSPWQHKLTPGRPEAGEHGSRVIVRTSPAVSLARRIAALTGGLSVGGSAGSSAVDEPDDSDPIALFAQSVTIEGDIADRIKEDSLAYTKRMSSLKMNLEASLAASGKACVVDALYPEEAAFWNTTLLAIDPRVILKMPYRRLLGVIQDRQKGVSFSPFFNGKNKHNVFDHTFSYEFLCRVLSNAETCAFKMLYEADLSPEKDGSMMVSYYVIELHYPTEIHYIKSPNSTVGKLSDAEVTTELGERTSVIGFSQCPAALLDAYSKATIRNIDGSDRLFFANRFNWAFHAQHQKKVAPNLVPVDVRVVIRPDFNGRECIELEIVD